MSNAYRVLVGSVKGRDNLKDMGIDGRIYCTLFTFILMFTYITSLCLMGDLKWLGGVMGLGFGNDNLRYVLKMSLEPLRAA